MPRLPLLPAREHEADRNTTRGQSELLEVLPDRRLFVRDAKDADRRFVDLPDCAGGIDERHRERAGVDHRARAIGGGTSRGDGFR